MDKMKLERKEGERERETRGTGMCKESDIDLKSMLRD